jgi:purine nucleosidase
MRLGAVLVFVLCVLACNSSSNRSEDYAQNFEDNKTDIVICTDCGVEIDDQWMILHFTQSDRFNVLAIFSSHCGNYDYLASPQAESSMKEIVKLLGISNNKNVPVFIGSDYPLQNRHSVVQHTADNLFKLVKDYSSRNRISIIVSGPATDIASALVKYPEIENKIEIVATAFQSKQRGMSFNVGNDIVAWQVILERDVPVTVCPGPVAQRFFTISRESVDAVLDTETALGTYLYDNYIKWIEANECLVTSVTGNKDTWPIWDEILVSHLLGLTKTEKCQRPIMLDNGDLDFSHKTFLEPIEWVIEADDEKTWENHRASLK